MILKRQLLCLMVGLFLGAIRADTRAELPPPPLPPIADNAIANLYENLLQREYAGPIVFPNHQVERKAQRSPSLRLRFGRRSDPALLLSPSAAKRWFGDVRQKPIRSPSLRLRFGRRSDPDWATHDQLEALRNALPFEGLGNSGSDALEEDDQAVRAMTDTAAGMPAMDPGTDLDSSNYEEWFQRLSRKPQRLRWGRSLPPGELAPLEPQLSAEDFVNSLVNSEPLRKMLLRLRLHDGYGRAEDDMDMGEGEGFEREARKPGPLRLRFGRSAGGAVVAAKPQQPQKVAAAKDDAKEKPPQSQDSN